MGCSSIETRDQPTVSLITIVLNGGDALLRTFKSVFAQSFQPIEYIVIDGGSKDGSVDLIKRYNRQITYWVSEPDNGISHAFNKGIAAARGDYIGLLNADDWLSPNQIEEAVRALQTSKASFVFGDLLYHDPDGQARHLIRGDPQYGNKIKSRMPALNHPTMLVRRQVFDEVGGFDRRYQAAMDYDWVLRAHLAGHDGVYSKSIIGHMTLAGTSDREFIQALTDVRRIAVSHGQPVAAAWPLFGLRVMKAMVQRLLHRHTPTSFYRLLRGWFNRDYQSISGRPDGHAEKSGSSP